MPRLAAGRVAAPDLRTQQAAEQAATWPLSRRVPQGAPGPGSQDLEEPAEHGIDAKQVEMWQGIGLEYVWIYLTKVKDRKIKSRKGAKPYFNCWQPSPAPGRVQGQHRIGGQCMLH